MLKVYSVFDSKANAWLLPFFAVNRAVAIRNFTTAASDGKTTFCRYPADFTLFEIGAWDPAAGAGEYFEVKVSLGTALEFKAVSEEN